MPWPAVSFRPQEPDLTTWGDDSPQVRPTGRGVVTLRHVDVAALLIAVLALGVSAGSLWWQYETWRRERTLDVSVELYAATNAQREDVDGRKETTFKNEFSILVVNRSAFPVRVAGATIAQAGATPGSYFTHARPLVGPRDAESINLESELFSSKVLSGPIEPGDSVEAWVELSTGEQFRSGPIIVPPHFGRTASGGDELTPTK